MHCARIYRSIKNLHHRYCVVYTFPDPRHVIKLEIKYEGKEIVGISTWRHRSQ
jgi:hypothetical protein